MRSTTQTQSGSHLVALSLGIVVAGVVAFAGYQVIHQDKKEPVSTNTTAAPAKIESQADLQQASESLDSSDTTLSSDLDSSELDASLNDLL